MEALGGRGGIAEVNKRSVTLSHVSGLKYNA
jgi:hypothetical protein